MTKNELKEETKNISEIIKKIFSKDNYIDLVLFIKFRNTKNEQQRAVILLPPEAIEKRKEILANIGFLIGSTKTINSQEPNLNIENVDIITIASETWYTKQKAEENNNSFIAPSQDPNRLEGVTIISMANDKTTEAIMYDIKQTFDGQKIKRYIDKPNEELTTINNKHYKGSKAPLLEGFWHGFQAGKLISNPNTLNCTT